MIKSVRLASKNTGEFIEVHGMFDFKTLNYTLLQKINHFLEQEDDFEFVKLEIVIQRIPEDGRIDFDFLPKDSLV